MNAEPTAGEWRAEGQNVVAGDLWIGAAILDGGMSEASALANACLWAASKRLREALQRLLSVQVSSNPFDHDEAEAFARAALAAAEGEEPQHG